jgi:hypothetical protein
MFSRLSVFAVVFLACSAPSALAHTQIFPHSHPHVEASGWEDVLLSYAWVLFLGFGFFGLLRGLAALVAWVKGE